MGSLPIVQIGRESMNSFDSLCTEKAGNLIQDWHDFKVYISNLAIGSLLGTVEDDFYCIN